MREEGSPNFSTSARCIPTVTCCNFSGVIAGGGAIGVGGSAFSNVSGAKGDRIATTVGGAGSASRASRAKGGGGGTVSSPRALFFATRFTPAPWEDPPPDNGPAFDPPPVEISGALAVPGFSAGFTSGFAFFSSTLAALTV
jgi:hypothetical protein